MTSVPDAKASTAHSATKAQMESKDPCRDLGEMPWIHAGGGNDRIYGGKTAYRLFGEKDRDFIIGSEGGEIHGGEDADVLVGYGGTDRFVYDSVEDSLPDRKGRWSAKTGDTIVDFRTADHDLIDLRPLRMTGGDAPKIFEWSSWEPQSYSVWMSRRGDDTIILVDVDGNARGDVVIRLLGEVRLSPSDFCGVEISD
jgi:hypothetical protein